MPTRPVLGSALVTGLTVGAVVIAGHAPVTAVPRQPVPEPAASSEPWDDDAAFTGEPSVSAQAAVAELCAARAAADLLGVGLGTLAPLIAVADPPDPIAVGLRVERGQFDGMPVVTLHPAVSSGEVVVGVHGGAYVVEPTVLHRLDYATMARDTSATVVVPIHPPADTPHGRAATVVPAPADLVNAQIGAHGAANVSLYGDSVGGGSAPAVSMTNPVIASVADPVPDIAALRRAGPGGPVRCP